MELQKRPIFKALGDRPFKSEVVAAWNAIVPERPLTMEVDNGVLAQCTDFLRVSFAARYEFEINKMRGHAFEAMWNEQAQRYEVIGL